MNTIMNSGYTREQAQALLAKHDYPRALAAFRALADTMPDDPFVWEGCGVSAFQTGDLPQALESYRQLTRLRPEYPVGHYSLAVVLDALGDAVGAIAAYRQALMLLPGEPVLHYNLGVILQRVHKLPDAEACYREAVRLQPTLPEASNNLGIVLAARAAWDEAIKSYGRAIAARPGFIDVRNNLGVAQVQKGDLSQAESVFRETLGIEPGNATALRYLGSTLKHQGRLDEALVHYRQGLEIEPLNSALRSDYLLALNYLPNQDPEAVFSAHVEWGNLHGSLYPPSPLPGNGRNPDRMLRIGYVSADFYEHSVARFIEPVLEKYDRHAFEVYCYADVAIEDAVTARVQALPLRWRSIAGRRDADVAEQIRRDGIDILVDLSGHTGGNRLTVFASKLAPVQVSYLGYPNTTGLTAVDYRLTDRIADPPGSENWYAERLVYLDDGFLCYRGDTDVPWSAAPPVQSLGYPTFGSFNNLAKITPGVIALWVCILATVTDARLVVKNKSLRDAVTRQRYADLFADQGIAPDRLELIGWLPNAVDHLALYNRIDVALDTFPYNGTTTTCEALWMGVPVVTLRGDRHAARVSASLLTRVGLEDLVAEDLDGYARSAAALVQDENRLVELRTGLRQRMQASPLCDGDAFVRQLENAYREMWRQWCGQWPRNR